MNVIENFLTELKETCELLLNPKVASVIASSDIRKVFEGKEFKSGTTTYKFVVDEETVKIDYETEDIGCYW